MQIGNYSVSLLETCRFGLDGGAMFGVIPKPLWSKVYHPGDELNRIPMSARCLLIQNETMNILVDTGNGTKLSEKNKHIYNLDTQKYNLEQSLAAKNLTYSSITHVILTHLHFDHVGGATIRNDHGDIVPTFENAQYFVQKGQAEYAKTATEKDRASFMPENYQILFDNNTIELIDGNGELFPGISLHCVHGHTPSMQMVSVHSHDQTLLYAADLFPTHGHINIPYGMGYDNFPLTTIEEKKYWLPKIVDENILVVFEHDAFKDAAYFQRTEKGYSIAKEQSLQ